jgi:hypothetical protein
LEAAARNQHSISQAARGKSPARKAGGQRVWLTVALAIPAVATLWGLPYYAAGIAERVRSPLHALLKPSGTVGQAFGVAGLLLFLFLWLYPLRTHARWLAFTGSAGAWMRVHAVVGIALPFLVAVHASWHFRGLIGLGYAAMVLVSLSGLVGRYLYARIPRARTGVELTREEVSGQRRTLVTEIAAALGRDPREIESALEELVVPARGTGARAAVRRLLTDDLTRWRALRALRRRWTAPGPGGPAVDPKTLTRALALARRELALAQQLRVLQSTQRLLRYWHVAHRPVAVTALLAVLVHVGVAIALGQTWLR